MEVGGLADALDDARARQQAGMGVERAGAVVVAEERQAFDRVLAGLRETFELDEEPSDDDDAG